MLGFVQLGYLLAAAQRIGEDHAELLRPLVNSGRENKLRRRLQCDRKHSALLDGTDGNGFHRHRTAPTLSAFTSRLTQTFPPDYLSA